MRNVYLTSEAGQRLEMKNQKAKEPTPSKRPDIAQKRPGTVERSGLVLSSDHREMSFEYWPRPTELELARLAATLARAGTVDPKQLVKRRGAFTGKICQKIKEDYLEVERDLRAMEVSDADTDDVLDEEGELPRPKKYPVSFQEMELLLLPKLKGRTGERAALFREYLFAQMVDRGFSLDGDDNGSSYWDCGPECLEEWRNSAQDDVATEFGNCRSKVYDAQSYASFGTSFLRWYRTWTEHRNSEIKAANALRGWEKRRKAKTTRTGARPKRHLSKQSLNGALKNRSPGA